MRRVGFQVHGWRYPVVWWARRKPRSRFRQWAWDAVDRIDWHVRVLPMLKRIRREYDERERRMAMTDLHIPRHWRYRLIRVLELPENVENLRFLAAWAQAEGGTAQYNPLNTTYPLPWGASDYNSVHVKNYATPIEGICAMALTLGMTPYAAILTAMGAGTHSAEQIVGFCRSALTNWGSNPDLILDVLKTM